MEALFIKKDRHIKVRISSKTTYYSIQSILGSKTIFLAFFFVLFFQSDVLCQKQAFFAPADTLDKARFYTGLGFAVGSFTATSIGLYNSWYKQFDQSDFHLFNDWKEWKGMDKLGHAYTSYNLCNIGYQGARWTGLSKTNGLWFAGIGSTIIQTTIEVMDGFSTKWGFSVGDVLFNSFGTASFILQEAYWDEQKFRLKISSHNDGYPEYILTSQNGNSTSLQDRVNNLYGDNGLEQFLKDYNKQTIWLSANVRSLIPKAPVPKWLNLSFGYSPENLFGGFENSWTIGDDLYTLSNDLFPRSHQFTLSFDADLNRIKTSNHFLNTLLALTNSMKIPAPAIEYNSIGEWRFYLVLRG